MVIIHLPPRRQAAARAIPLIVLITMLRGLLSQAIPVMRLEAITAPPVTMARLPPITLLTRLQAQYPVQDQNHLLPGNAPQVFTGCLIVMAGVWLMAILMCRPAHLIFPPELQPLKQDHIIAAASLMTRSPKNAKTGPVRAVLTGTAANV